MKRLLLSLVATVCLISHSYAEEGMWLLPFIDQNMGDMKSKGLELLPRNINSIQPAGKAIGNSIVQFGNGCTGAVISPTGLVITNHHCAYSYIHGLSTMDNNLLRTGFWATGNNEDIPIPGLTVTFVRYMGNVTNEILKGLEGGLNNQDREYMIESNKNALLFYYQNQYKNQYNGDNFKFAITSYFNGEFYIFTITETYQDIRLVGVPPESIGKFGGEAANWQWPRYTGDFSLFRIYTAPDGSPAAYSENNIPYKTKAFLKISDAGYSEGDFAMVLGFPGSTQRYIPESDLNFFIETKVKPTVEVSSVLTDILKKEMDQNKDVEFKYGPKYNLMSNTYLKYKGMLDGLDKYGVYSEAKARDGIFTEWANKSIRKKYYENTLQTIKKYNDLHHEISKAGEYIYETLVDGIDLLNIVQLTNRLRSTSALTNKSKERLAGLVESIYKNYDIALDRTLAYEAFKMLVEKVPEAYLPKEFKYDLDVNYKGDTKAYVDYLYDRTAFKSPASFMDQWEGRSQNQWAEDQALRLLASVQNALMTLSPQNVNSQDNGAMLRDYTAASADYALALRESGIVKYPNAGRNMRLTYGTVDGYSTAERGKLNYYTTIDEMMGVRKDTGSELPRTFTELYTSKDLGNYAMNDTLRVNFLTSTDITGGNSGSPVLNSKGDIIGLVFDNNAEALTGDVLYNGDVNRSVNVDIKYILYIIDKYAGAKNIMDEITLSTKTNNDAPAPFEPEFTY